MGEIMRVWEEFAGLGAQGLCWCEGSGAGDFTLGVLLPGHLQEGADVGGLLRLRRARRGEGRC